MIDLDDAKRHLNITTTDDDTLIGDKIDAASAWLDCYTGAHWADGDWDGDRRVPEPLREACRQLVAHLYANREASLVGVTAQVLPFGLLDLLAPYRVFAF